jgi:hypothetical protein
VRPPDLLYFLRVNLMPFPEGDVSGTCGFQVFLKQLSYTAFGHAALRKVSFGLGDIALSNVPVAAVLCAVVAVALWVTWRSRAPLEELLALWVLAFFLVFKDIWEYHYVMLLPVLTLLYLRSGSKLVLAVWIVLALPTAFALYSTGFHPRLGWRAAAGIVHAATKSVPTLVLYVWLARRLTPAVRL